MWDILTWHNSTLSIAWWFRGRPASLNEEDESPFVGMLRIEAV
jgi:hypothetical protein